MLSLRPRLNLGQVGWLAVSPCLRAFWAERAFPSSERGPVERRASVALAAARAGEGVMVLSRRSEDSPWRRKLARSCWKDGSCWFGIPIVSTSPHLAEKIKKGQFKLGGRKATMSELWHAALAA